MKTPLLRLFNSPSATTEPQLGSKSLASLLLSLTPTPTAAVGCLSQHQPSVAGYPHCRLSSSVVAYLRRPPFEATAASESNKVSKITGKDAEVKASNGKTIMGRKSYAEFVMKLNMASSPEVVVPFLLEMSNVVKARADKPTKPGLEEPQEHIHKTRTTLSSKNVKNLEKVCADLVHSAKDKRLRVNGPVRMPTKVLRASSRLHVVGTLAQAALNNRDGG
ncbi:hypothetical protein V6N12_018749 [Hibiscus sabdariffa]|uniref:Small ribosomal subunit protein uS10 domain-containing protein n=1 Tax=Hibiscus sabdariffa TaxID=183260 RepID=A0ABR2AV51_9ROSI